MRSRRLSGGLALTLALCLCGCGTISPLKRLFGKREFPQATAQNPVVEVVAIWQPAEGTGLDGLPTRGFAGQILFFTRGTDEPCRVDGTARVYLFENTGPVSERVKPIHQFDFTPASWNTHLCEGTLGATYQLFVPYPKRNPHQTSCSLRVRFEPVSGPRVFSDSVNVTLPGPVQLDDPVMETTPKAGGPSMRSLSIPLRPHSPKSRETEPAGTPSVGTASVGTASAATKSAGAIRVNEPTSAAPTNATSEVQRTVTANLPAEAPPAPPAPPATGPDGDTENDAAKLAAEAERLREIEAKLEKLLAERSEAIHELAAEHDDSPQVAEQGTEQGAELVADAESDFGSDFDSALPRRFQLSRSNAPQQNPLAGPPEPDRHDFDNAGARPATFDALLEEHSPSATTPHPLAELSE